MSHARRFQDDEIRQILELAIGEDERPSRALPAADGLTLVELQEVGREVGLPPERITQAVAVFEGRGVAVPRGTTMGLPTTVGRVVPLPRNPTEREWELIVAELRMTFGVKGELTSHGGLREWSNGSLHAFIEPTETGHRLRLVDSSAAVAGIGLGGIFLAFALLILVVLLGKADPGSRLAVPAFFALIGGGLVARSAAWLPRWARETEQRMEQLGGHAALLLARPRAAADAGESPSTSDQR